MDLIKQYKGKMSKTDLIESFKNIKDFNDLQLKFKSKPISDIFDFNKYFSKDELDIYYYGFTKNSKCII